MSSILSCPQTTDRPPKGLVEKILLHHCYEHKTSFIAALHHQEDRPLQVIAIEDNRRYCLGVIVLREPDTFYQDSKEEWISQEEAEAALMSRNWTQLMDLPTLPDE